ncbi:MAG: hypothetical protein EU550_00975 [Promethearchaeota archaeon]|nr:MAG: hypothetical protein EU550_00975 [Candidatus Lokiarchaeota archaeon]
MDTARKVDDFLYTHKAKIFTRSLEFIIFGILTLFISLWTWRYFHRFSIIFQTFAPIFYIIFWVDIVLILFVILRAIITKKFAAFITLFFLLTFFYVLYIILSVIYTFLTADISGFLIVSLIVDIFLFTLILGSLFDKADFLEEKVKIIKADTFALFLFIMKIIVQIFENLPKTVYDEKSLELNTALGLLLIFIAANLIIGLISIFTKKEGKKGKM